MWQGPAAIDPEELFEQPADGCKICDPVREWCECASNLSHGMDICEQSRTERRGLCNTRFARLCPQALDRMLENANFRRAESATLIATDAVLDATQLDSLFGARSSVPRVQGKARELHQGRGSDKFIAISRAGGYANHAFDAVQHFGRAAHLLTRQRFRKSCVLVVSLELRFEEKQILHILAAIYHQIPDDREVRQRLDDHLWLNRLPATQKRLIIHQEPAHTAFFHPAEPLIGQTVANLLHNIVEDF